MARYEELTDKFLKFERDNDLLSIEIRGVYLWEIVRTYVFLAIVDCYIKGNAIKYRRSLFEKIQVSFRRLFVNSIFFNPFFDFKKSDVLVFDSGRKYFVENNYIDIYTHYFSEKLSNNKMKVTKYETNYNADLPIKSREKNSRHLDFIFLASRIIGVFKKYNLKSVERESITMLNYKLVKEFDCDINLKKMLVSHLNKFSSELLLFNLLFRLKSPKQIYVVNSTDKPALVFAAKKNNIVVNELQHGLVSDKSVIYNFPHTKEESLRYFPNRFFVWNNVDMFFAKLPLKSENIFFFENEHITNLIRLTDNVIKSKNSLLVISQPYGSEQIQEFILNNIEDMKDYNFVYKIHPAESIISINKFINKCEIYSNLRFVENEESIYNLMKESKYAIGVYSSALFEANLFGCEILLLRLPGVEMSMPLINKGIARLVDVKKSLRDVI